MIKRKFKKKRSLGIELCITPGVVNAVLFSGVLATQKKNSRGVAGFWPPQAISPASGTIFAKAARINWW